MPKHPFSVGFVTPFLRKTRATIERALREAESLGARTVALPAIARGYGPLSFEVFATGLARALRSPLAKLEEIRVVLRREEDLLVVERVLREFDEEEEAGRE